jgi:hypothetical protein
VIKATIGAGSRLAVASSRTIALHEEEEYGVITKLCGAQLGFVVAHELAHLAFSEYPDLAMNSAEGHRQVLRHLISEVYPDTVKPGDRESVRARLKQQGYSLSARSRYLSKFQETERATPALQSWDLVSKDKEFMIEVLADHVACIALLVSHRTNYSPEFLATAATFAVNNLNTLQYLDQLITGDHPASLAGQPEADVWQARMRAFALTKSIVLIAVAYEEEGRPEYQGSIPRIGQAIEDANRYHMEHFMEPLIYSIDFGAIERIYSSDDTITAIARTVGHTSDDVRRFLGFASDTSRADFTKYLNIALLRDNTQVKLGEIIFRNLLHAVYS